MAKEIILIHIEDITPESLIGLTNTPDMAFTGELKLKPGKKAYRITASVSKESSFDDSDD